MRLLKLILPFGGELALNNVSAIAFYEANEDINGPSAELEENGGKFLGVDVDAAADVNGIEVGGSREVFTFSTQSR